MNSKPSRPGAARRALGAVLVVGAVFGSACSAHTDSSAVSSPSSSTNPTSGGAACAAQNTRYCSAEIGDLIDTTLGELHPTQPSLGYDELFYRLGRYTLGKNPNAVLDAWCATNGQKGLKSANAGATLGNPSSFTCEMAVGSETPESIAPMKTAVVGPGGQLYLTDGHHTLTSFWEAPGGGPTTHVRLNIAGNLSNLAPEAFWRTMQTNGWTWLQDVNGNPITPNQLPANLGLKQFANDKYRGVLYFARNIGYRQDDNSPPFQEFYWAQWLRGQTDPSLQPDNFDLASLSPYLTLVGNIAKAIVALPDSAQIANGRTAHDLNKLEAFGQEAFDALSQPYDSPKPGKLAYAISYKTSH